MPRCPSCSKVLPSDNAVLRHMNQPTSRCFGWVDNLVQIGELLEQESEEKNIRNSKSPQLAHWQSIGECSAPDDNMDIDRPELEPDRGTIEEFPGAARVFAQQQNSFLDHFDRDRFSEERRSNLYYPFASRADWEFGLWLTRSGLSMAAIDSFLSLELVSSPYSSCSTCDEGSHFQAKTLPLSFRTAQQLRGLVEILPKGPEWRCRTLSTKVPTKSPIRLFYRDPVECLEALFNHPLFHDKLTLVPRRVYRTAERLVRVYSDWMSGNAAWEMQVSRFCEL